VPLPLPHLNGVGKNHPSGDGPSITTFDKIGSQ
jgi:hypothetical protein